MEQERVRLNDGVEVEVHGYKWWDEDLKQAITQAESALVALRNLG